MDPGGERVTPTRTPARIASQAVFLVGMNLSRIKTPRLVKQVHWPAPSAQPKTRIAGLQWAPCRLSVRLVHLSVWLDREHWMHWACMHGRACSPCWECGGFVCPEPESDDEE